MEKLIKRLKEVLKEFPEYDVELETAPDMCDSCDNKNEKCGYCCLADVCYGRKSNTILLTVDMRVGS